MIKQYSSVKISGFLIKDSVVINILRRVTHDERSFYVYELELGHCLEELVVVLVVIVFKL